MHYICFSYKTRMKLTGTFINFFQKKESQRVGHSFIVGQFTTKCEINKMFKSSQKYFFFSTPSVNN